MLFGFGSQRYETSSNVDALSQNIYIYILVAGLSKLIAATRTIVKNIHDAIVQNLPVFVDYAIYQ
jgi:hypothetical protein